MTITPVKMEIVESPQYHGTFGIRATYPDGEVLPWGKYLKTLNGAKRKLVEHATRLGMAVATDKLSAAKEA
jgi:hypothetical protein